MTIVNDINLQYQSDWRALRGALVGCLALMRRKTDTGVISGSDANAVAQSFMQNLQVQSLGQHDRKVLMNKLGIFNLDWFDSLSNAWFFFSFVLRF